VKRKGKLRIKTEELVEELNVEIEVKKRELASLEREKAMLFKTLED
jgi:hypothetical protein